MPTPVPVPRRWDTAEGWAATALILGRGEVGVNITDGTTRNGDGIRSWADLPIATDEDGGSSEPGTEPDLPDLSLIFENALL